MEGDDAKHHQEKQLVGVQMTEQAKPKRFSDSVVPIIAIWLGFAANCGGCVAIKIFEPRASEPLAISLFATGGILIAIGWFARTPWRIFALILSVPYLIFAAAAFVHWLRS
jgi:hypothetical protein